MENIILRYFLMSSERKTSFVVDATGFFSLNLEQNVADLRHRTGN